MTATYVAAAVFLALIVAGVLRWTGALERHARERRGLAERARRVYFDQQV